MKTFKTFKKGTIIYCFLSSYTMPNVLIPVKGVIIEVKWDRVNPQYRIKILKFYDTLKFLKTYFFDMKFKYKWDDRPRHMIIDKNEFKNLKQLNSWFSANIDERFYVIVESIMCTKTLLDLQKLFEKLQFYIISKNLKEIKEISTRSFLTGPLALDSVHEFDVRFKKGWSDKFEKASIDIDKYLKSL